VSQAGARAHQVPEPGTDKWPFRSIAPEAIFRRATTEVAGVNGVFELLLD
jgi:hypothetical protein